MFLKKQHHMAIIVSDYAKAKEFYIDKLGFELYREIYRPEQNIAASPPGTLRTAFPTLPCYS